MIIQYPKYYLFYKRNNLNELERLLNRCVLKLCILTEGQSNRSDLPLVIVRLFGNFKDGVTT